MHVALIGELEVLDAENGSVSLTYGRHMFNDEVKALVQGRNFATISTLLPKGNIQTHVVWVDCDEDHILINTEVELRKFKNVQADPRVTVTVWDKKNPYFFAEVRGHVVEHVTGSAAARTSTRLPRSTSKLTTPTLEENNQPLPAFSSTMTKTTSN